MEISTTTTTTPPEQSYLKQIFQEFLEKRNVLVVLAKGLGVQLLFVKLVSLYCIRERSSALETEKNGEHKKKTKAKLYIILNASSCSKSRFHGRFKVADWFYIAAKIES